MSRRPVCFCVLLAAFALAPASHGKVRVVQRTFPGGIGAALTAEAYRGAIEVEASPDQQFQAGLSCNGVFATPPSAANPTGTPIIASGLCPSSQYRSIFLKIPAPGTENDDRNPPRVAPRNLFDVALGHDNIFHGDRYKWSAQITVINLTNKVTPYNFLSTFSGTHYVTPRAVTAQIGFHF